MSPQEQKTRPDHPTEPRHRLGISLTQVVGSAVAAAAAAFGASYLGVAGTIIGAAVASAIATVASAMYTTSVHRTREVVRTTVTQWTGSTAVAPVVDPGAPPAPEPAPAGDRPRWPRVAVAAAAVLAVALGGITAVEALAGKPLATVVGSSSAGGTTLGAIDGSGHTTRKPRTTVPTPATTVTPTDPAPSGTPTTQPTTAPTSGPTSDPTASPSAEPTAPTTPTTPTAPTTGPTPTPGTAPAGG